MRNNSWNASLAKHYSGFFSKPAPCDYCMHWNRCKEQLLACDVFYAYVNRNQHWKKIDRVPTREIWNKIYIYDKDEDEDKGDK